MDFRSHFGDLLKNVQMDSNKSFRHAAIGKPKRVWIAKLVTFVPYNVSMSRKEHASLKFEL
jgi:hypothetical protein